MVEAKYFFTALADFSGLHIVMSQKIEPFITAAMRFSYPTQCKGGFSTYKNHFVPIL
jgi:hypothetical protein